MTFPSSGPIKSVTLKYGIIYDGNPHNPMDPMEFRIAGENETPDYWLTWGDKQIGIIAIEPDPNRIPLERTSDSESVP